MCLVGVLVDGGLRVEQDGRQAVLGPGDLSFIDPARPFEQSFTRRRRLERCRQDLRDPEQRYRPGAAIGTHWGFLSAAHFSRAFRDEYGIPPAEFRARSAMLARDET